MRTEFLYVTIVIMIETYLLWENVNWSAIRYRNYLYEYSIVRFDIWLWLTLIDVVERSIIRFVHNNDYEGIKWIDSHR